MIKRLLKTYTLSTQIQITLTFLLFSFISYSQPAYQYPFQNPKLDAEKRIDNIISLLTRDEKIQCLSTNPAVPRLGIKGTGQMEGLHGVALGGPGGWGRRKLVTTTTFCQSYGLAETWDTVLIRKVAATEAYEARYITQSEKYKTGGLVIRAPNADIGRDPAGAAPKNAMAKMPGSMAAWCRLMSAVCRGTIRNTGWLLH